jgi:hypothetical protein
MGGQNANMPRNPTAAAAKRALTTSFGSICFGSLIVAVIQTVRTILRSLRSRSANNAAVMLLLWCVRLMMLFCFVVFFFA